MSHIRASEPRDRPAFAPKALRRGGERGDVWESEGQSPSDKTVATSLPAADPA